MIFKKYKLSLCFILSITYCIRTRKRFTMSFNSLPITGRNISAANISDLLKEETQMLVFLRHLGCNLSMQLVSDIVEIEKKYNIQLPLTYVSQGSKNYSEFFWKSRHPEAAVIYDTNLTISKHFGLKEGSVSQVLNSKAMFCSLKAMANGHFPGSFQGNVFMLPGIFVFAEGRRIYSHIADSASDMPDFENLVKTYILKALTFNKIS